MIAAIALAVALAVTPEPVPPEIRAAAEAAYVEHLDSIDAIDANPSSIACSTVEIVGQPGLLGGFCYAVNPALFQVRIDLLMSRDDGETFDFLPFGDGTFSLID